MSSSRRRTAPAVAAADEPATSGPGPVRRRNPPRASRAPPVRYEPEEVPLDDDESVDAVVDDAASIDIENTDDESESEEDSSYESSFIDDESVEQLENQSSSD